MPNHDPFLLALDEVLKHEGGYNHDPDDPGGETNFGLSKRAYPHLDIPRLTREAAAAIYRQDYWVLMRGDELPPGVAMVLFDTAVNMGRNAAVRMLQESLPGLKVDGVFGPGTMDRVRGANPAHLVAEIFSRRGVRYAQLVMETPTQQKYLRGWMLRCFKVAQKAWEMSHE